MVPVKKTLSNLIGDRGFKGLFAFSEEDGSAGSITYPIRSDFFTIIVVAQGNFKVRVNLKEYQLTQNTFAVASPSALKEVVDISKDCRYTGLVFTPEYLADVGMNQHRVDAMHFFTSNHLPLVMLQSEDQERLTRLMKQLRDVADYPVDYPYSADILRHLFLVLIFEMAGIAERYAASGEPQHSADRKEGLTVSFAALVTRHFREKRKVFEYAEMLHVTPKYLSQAIKDYTGKSAGTYIDEAIIREACFLLLNPALSIQQITDELNFPNQSQFGKFFKHHTGYSPRAYRKKAAR